MIIHLFFFGFFGVAVVIAGNREDRDVEILDEVFCLLKFFRKRRCCKISGAADGVYLMVIHQIGEMEEGSDVIKGASKQNEIYISDPSF